MRILQPCRQQSVKYTSRGDQSMSNQKTNKQNNQQTNKQNNQQTNKQNNNMNQTNKSSQANEKY